MSWPQLSDRCSLSPLSGFGSAGIVRSEPGKRNPHDLATGPYRLIPPAAQQANPPQYPSLAGTTTHAGASTMYQTPGDAQIILQYSPGTVALAKFLEIQGPPNNAATDLLERDLLRVEARWAQAAWEAWAAWACPCRKPKISRAPYAGLRVI